MSRENTQQKNTVRDLLSQGYSAESVKDHPLVTNRPRPSLAEKQLIDDLTRQGYQNASNHPLVTGKSRALGLEQPESTTVTNEEQVAIAGLNVDRALGIVSMTHAMHVEQANRAQHFAAGSVPLDYAQRVNADPHTRL